jgi:hypothetical protein
VPFVQFDAPPARAGFTLPQESNARRGEVVQAVRKWPTQVPLVRVESRSKVRR